MKQHIFIKLPLISLMIESLSGLELLFTSATKTEALKMFLDPARLQPRLHRVPVRTEIALLSARRTSSDWLYGAAYRSLMQ